MNASEDFENFLNRSGVSLAPLGIRDVGFSRDDALKAIELLRNGRLPVLGGDVYFRRGDKIEAAYANWYADPRPSETYEMYLRRSWNEAEGYLRSFPEPANAEVLFAIVVGRESDSP